MNEELLELMTNVYYQGMRAGIGMSGTFYDKAAQDPRVSHPLDGGEVANSLLDALAATKQERLLIIRTAIVETFGAELQATA